MLELIAFHHSAQSQIQSKMGSILLKKTAFLILLVFTHNSFVLCEEASENLERRINELETLNSEIITELQSMRIKGQEAQNELHELKYGFFKKLHLYE